MEREFDRTTYIKKGPWSCEEDEVLLKHVNKYGPKDWSSIRSKGLLPRTGKSCRLRWVNKLRPNLKSGCKFSAEEERVVIELQAQFGNKWAKIATYLQGRTDNDVKNFWSSRRKRLERMLQRPSQQKNKGKAPLNQVQVEEVPPCSSNQLEESLTYSTSYMGNTEVFEMVNLPDLTKSNYQSLESDLNAVKVEATPLHMVTPFESSSGYNFPLLPEPQMDFPLFPECHDLVPEHYDTNLIGMFEQKKCSECLYGQKLGTRLPTLGLEGNSQSTSSNGFFKDFPTDIFEYFEHIPSSSEQ
ncbi:transcription factor DUO1-like [Gastrolobium bilobum]|uniref:transcription factor DUO1-like n=1 Tax=Gastrolobium bilobum TaxID=150636 RepID=UPI002AB26E69|nr:transcription factor DUO1-like [Gastrolobium bilobum]